LLFILFYFFGIGHGGKGRGLVWWANESMIGIYALLVRLGSLTIVMCMLVFFRLLIPRQGASCLASDPCIVRVWPSPPTLEMLHVTTAIQDPFHPWATTTDMLKPLQSLGTCHFYRHLVFQILQLPCGIDT
jgi:hypothetical protein